MRVLIDAVCGSGHKAEYFVENSERTVRCKVCGSDAQRVVSAVKCNLDPISGHFPSATDKWAKHHEQAAKVAG